MPTLHRATARAFFMVMLFVVMEVVKVMNGGVVIMCDGWREAAAESGKYPCRGVTYAHGVQERDAQVLRESLVPLLFLLNVAD
jgi:hypothetical protein